MRDRTSLEGLRAVTRHQRRTMRMRTDLDDLVLPMTLLVADQIIIPRKSSLANGTLVRPILRSQMRGLVGR